MKLSPTEDVLMTWRNASCPNDDVPPAFDCCQYAAWRDGLDYVSWVENYDPEHVAYSSDGRAEAEEAQGTMSALAHLRGLIDGLSQMSGHRPDTLVLQHHLCCQIAEQPGDEPAIAEGQSSEEYLRTHLSIPRIVTCDSLDWNYNNMAILCLRPGNRAAKPFASMEMQPLDGKGYSDSCCNCNSPTRWRVVPGDEKMGMLVYDFADFPIIGGTLRKLAWGRDK